MAWMVPAVPTPVDPAARQFQLMEPLVGMFEEVEVPPENAVPLVLGPSIGLRISVPAPAMPV